jgi:hypothetical protein
MEERRSKDECMLAIIKNKERLVVDYASNINFNVLAGSIERLGVSRNSFQG